MTSMNDPETTADTEARRAGDQRAERLARDVEDRERASDERGTTDDAEPMTDSTDGGLDGGDPGVEE
ncbi:hypothetical protein PX701_00420 [Agromyces sp. H3Y2-19a]|jgi:hypothetical protein|uniref:hypothetical protein n=1 Tax=Agromyces TaxID=33877 RepID=UPI001E2B5A75|nr:MULTISPECIES: hypothetical protein [Agromyces]MCD5345703.1 hypothetical protein [Agromyces sp. S2-1-8]MDF0512070.1 hypothetical protein [Agromyces chromiiresistens]